MRKALIVGVKDEKNPLKGSIKDAQKLANILSKNYDLSPNFYCDLLLSSEMDITEGRLRNKVVDLFKYESDVALFYYSGHGAFNEFDSYLLTQDNKIGDLGLPINDIIKLANQSPVKEIIIILDCCFSGQVGNFFGAKNNLAFIKNGVSILASSRKNQPSEERHGQGVFSKIIIDALKGYAADILGNITVASIYNYADKLLNPFEQRPVFKAHISKMISLRQTKPKIDWSLLSKLITYFPDIDTEYQLSPAYEPTSEPRETNKEIIFSHLQKLTAANMIKPQGEEHMYFAAINNKTCILTPLGRFYWNMVIAKNNPIF